MPAPRVLILHASGTNRDREAALACAAAGGSPEIVHMNRLLAGESRLQDYQMIVIPGGFSFGDDLGAGRLWAFDLGLHLREDMDAFVAAGKPVMGICNGFQTLVKAGYLPGPAPAQRASLTFNRQGHFECRWVRLRAGPSSVSLFTEGLQEDILCPVAHGEGRLALEDPEDMPRLLSGGLVPLRYVAAEDLRLMDVASAQVPVRAAAGYPANPNGSLADAAALCNAEGNVLGLMPHPEDHIDPLQHPRWARGAKGGLGLSLFANGVRAAARFL
ncbi:MAG: phosphoribosylformylglycinamidine synthase subunit PurQ [Chloroflexi bacterium]|nr:phosphoribosylformylglycinamidine synthase subunit PurQ [Chloroflexota bacterium]